MKKILRPAALLLVFSLLLCVSVPAAATEEDLFSLLREAAEAGAADLSVEGMNLPADSFHDLYVRFLNENPDLFWLEPVCSFEADMNTGTVVRVLLSYEGSLHTEKARADFDAAVRKALQSVPVGAGDAAVCLALHDWLTAHVEYDQADYLPGSDFSAYGALVDGCCVCEGYARAYSVLLGKCGIESRLVISEELNHMWNLVKLDGEWYHVDVTWDDPLGTDETFRVFFLRSDTALKAAQLPGSADRHTSWTSDVACTSTRYDPASALQTLQQELAAGTRCPFDDVNPASAAAEAILWAWQKGVTTGTQAPGASGTGGLFGPEATCTRAQVVTFLWRAMGKPEPEAAENPFTDVEADSWYEKPVLWAVGRSITNGTGADTFSPDATCTYAQILTFLHRAMTGEIVSGEGSWYAPAMAWAAENGLTADSGLTAAAPDVQDCPRADTVLFLWRYAAAQA